MSLILAVPRRIVEGDKRTREGNWDGWSPTGMLGHRINGKRLGIVGMGRIGQAVARRAKGFGMSIHYHNRKLLHSEIENRINYIIYRVKNYRTEKQKLYNVIRSAENPQKTLNGGLNLTQ